MHTTSQDTRLHSEKVLQLARGTIRSPLGWQCDWNVGTAQKPSYCKITLACWTAYLKVCFDAFNVPIHTCYILIFLYASIWWLETCVVAGPLNNGGGLLILMVPNENVSIWT